MCIEKVKNCIKEITEYKEELNESANISIYGLDSLHRVELVIALEETFNINFNANDLVQENFETISNICNLLKKYGVK